MRYRHIVPGVDQLMLDAVPGQPLFNQAGQDLDRQAHGLEDADPAKQGAHRWAAFKPEGAGRRP